MMICGGMFSVEGGVEYIYESLLQFLGVLWWKLAGWGKFADSHSEPMSSDIFGVHVRLVVCLCTCRRQHPSEEKKMLCSYVGTRQSIDLYEGGVKVMMNSGVCQPSPMPRQGCESRAH